MIGQEQKFGSHIFDRTGLEVVFRHQIQKAAAERVGVLSVRRGLFQRGFEMLFGDSVRVHARTSLCLTPRGLSRLRLTYRKHAPHCR